MAILVLVEVTALLGRESPHAQRKRRSWVDKGRKVF
jgi:hypothetical protein